VIDHEQPSTTYREDLSVAGVHTWSATGAATGHRWITGKLPSAQSWTRTIGVSADVANCRAAITMTSGRGSLGTQVGRIGAALLVICTIVALFVGRGRSRITSTFAAIPFGILAGLGLSAVLYESGRLDPYGHGVLVAPVIGLVLALALPWSRRPDRSATTVTGGDPTDRDSTAGRDRTGDPEAAPSTPQQRVDDDGRGVAVAALIPAPAGAAAASKPVTEPAAVAGSGDHAHDPESTIEPTPARALAAALGDAPRRSGSGRTVRVVAAVVAGVVSAGAVAVFAASRPDQAAATASIDPAAANVIVAATWDDVLAGRTTHIDDPAQPMMIGLSTTPKLAKQPLHDVTVGVPVTAGATMFVATAQASVTGGNEYVYLRYRRADANAGWTVADLRYAATATGIPAPAFGPRGSLPTATGPTAAIYAKDYIAYLRQVNQAGKLVANDTFATPPASSDDSFLVTNAPNGGRHFGDQRIFATWTFTDAGGASEGAVPLVGGGTLVTFTVNVRLNIYNQTKAAPTPCTKISITRGTDGAHYRELIENSSLPVTVTTHRAGKATVDDTKLLVGPFSGVPC
jgi:hypothetical protein